MKTPPAHWQGWEILQRCRRVPSHPPLSVGASHFGPWRALRGGVDSVAELTGDAANLKIIQDVLGDILEILPGRPFMCTDGWGESMIDLLVEMRGLEKFYIDMIDAPEFVHEAMRLMTDMKSRLLELCLLSRYCTGICKRMHMISQFL